MPRGLLRPAQRSLPRGTVRPPSVAGWHIRLSSAHEREQRAQRGRGGGAFPQGAVASDERGRDDGRYIDSVGADGRKIQWKDHRRRLTRSLVRWRDCRAYSYVGGSTEASAPLSHLSDGFYPPRYDCTRERERMTSIHLGQFIKERVDVGGVGGARYDRPRARENVFASSCSRRRRRRHRRLRLRLRPLLAVHFLRPRAPMFIRGSAKDVSLP